MLIRVKSAGAQIPVDDMPDEMFITMLSEQALPCQDISPLLVSSTLGIDLGNRGEAGELEVQKSASERSRSSERTPRSRPRRFCLVGRNMRLMSSAGPDSSLMLFAKQGRGGPQRRLVSGAGSLEGRLVLEPQAPLWPSLHSATMARIIFAMLAFTAALAQESPAAPVSPIREPPEELTGDALVEFTRNEYLEALAKEGIQATRGCWLYGDYRNDIPNVNDPVNCAQALHLPEFHFMT
eukprot:s5548_g1.t1